MEKPKPMLTMSQIMSKLADKGITNEFRMNENLQMILEGNEHAYQPEDLKILKTFRFEGDSSPEDNAVLYVAADQKGNKGIIIDSYGAESNYSGEEFDNFLRNIPVDEDDEYNFY